MKEDAMHVFYMNKDVHEHNSQMLKQLESAEQTFPAVHILPKVVVHLSTSMALLEALSFFKN